MIYCHLGCADPFTEMTKGEMTTVLYTPAPQEGLHTSSLLQYGPKLNTPSSLSTN